YQRTLGSRRVTEQGPQHDDGTVLPVRDGTSVLCGPPTGGVSLRCDVAVTPQEGRSNVHSVTRTSCPHAGPGCAGGRIAGGRSGAGPTAAHRSGAVRSDPGRGGEPG